jgi:hypothetical protein
MKICTNKYEVICHNEIKLKCPINDLHHYYSNATHSTGVCEVPRVSEPAAQVVVR